MSTKQNVLMVCILLISVSVVGCGDGQLFGPTLTPPPTLTPTLKPVTEAELSAAALKSTELPAGFSPLSGDDLQGMPELQSIVTTDFPNAKVAGFTAYGKKLDTGQFDAIVLSFFFHPLSVEDIILFDNPDLAGPTFSHGAGRYEQLLIENTIGDYSVNISMFTGSFMIDEVVGRRENIGFAAMVLHGGVQFEKLDLATSAAQALNNKIQEILGE